MAKYIMALDAGTTSNRCCLFNEAGEVCSMAQKEFTQYFPQPGWVEHDANEIWSTQLEVARQAMEADSGIKLTALKVDGGASANNYLMQTQSDIIDAPVQRPKCVETTAMGAAYLAGLAVGYWKDREDVCKNWAIERTFSPCISGEQREKRLHGWNKAVKCALGWAGLKNREKEWRVKSGETGAVFDTELSTLNSSL